MARFIGRQRELDELNDTALLGGAKLIVIKGRRRVGKSTLAKEFARKQTTLKSFYFTGIPPTAQNSAQAERDNFAHQLEHNFNLPKIKTDNWDDLLWHLGDRVRHGHCLVILDEINWIAKSEHAFTQKLWRLWETQLSQLENFILILSGSLAGWIENKFARDTGYLGRISWNMTLEEMPLPDALRFFGKQRARISIYEQLKILLITGGIPRYLEEIQPKLSAEDNIRRLCFHPAGLLFNEYDQLLNDLFQRNNAIYRTIVESVADKPITLEELHKKIGRKKSGVISDYVRDLTACGFLSIHNTWNIKSGKPSNRYKIRLSDNYLRFYIKAIQPAISRILSSSNQLPGNYYSLLGLQFENLILKNKPLVYQALRIPVDEIIAEGPYYQNQTAKHPGCQFDYLVQTKYCYYVVEIKFTRGEIHKSVLTEVATKINALSTPRNMSIRPCLIHVNGVAESVVQADYFDRIVDFTEVLQNMANS